MRGANLQLRLSVTRGHTREQLLRPAQWLHDARQPRRRCLRGRRVCGPSSHSCRHGNYCGVNNSGLTPEAPSRPRPTAPIRKAQARVCPELSTGRGCGRALGPLLGVADVGDGGVEGREQGSGLGEQAVPRATGAERHAPRDGRVGDHRPRGRRAERHDRATLESGRGERLLRLRQLNLVDAEQRPYFRPRQLPPSRDEREYVAVVALLQYERLDDL